MLRLASWCHLLCIKKARRLPPGLTLTSNREEFCLQFDLDFGFRQLRRLDSNQRVPAYEAREVTTPQPRNNGHPLSNVVSMSLFVVVSNGTCRIRTCVWRFKVAHSATELRLQDPGPARLGKKENTMKEGKSQWPCVSHCYTCRRNRTPI